MPDMTLRNDSSISTIDTNNAIHPTYDSDEFSRAMRSLTDSMRSINYGNITVRNEYENINKQYIHSHDYIPDKFNFNKLSDEEELYMGVELEVDCGGEDSNIAKQSIDIVNQKSEIIYCKHDGSLRNGFEIVSHPCTYEYYKTIGYEKLFKFLVGKGYKSHDVSTCGLHVHINRKYFGDNKLTQDLCISKLLYIFEKFWDKVEVVARRKSNGYAKRFYLNDDESPIDLYVKSKDATKYGAINLQHKNTIEIRIFKGTLKYETFIYTLEFVKKIAKLVKDTDIYEIQYVTWDKVTDLFSDELNQYIVEREEQQKKEDKEELSKRIEQDRILRNSTSVGDLSNLSTTTASAGICTSDLMRYMSATWTNNTGALNNFVSEYSCEFANHELTEEEQLLRQIQGRRQLVRRSRNGLEITNLNRQIADLENQLRRLRRNRR